STLETQLSVVAQGNNHFKSNGYLHVPGANRGIFGGTLIAKSLLSAARTLPVNVQTGTSDFKQHSIHNTFVLGGDSSIDLQFRVERIRDGRNFVTREVKAYQNGAVIFISIISFKNVGNPQGSMSSLGPQLKYQPMLDLDGIAEVDECISVQDIDFDARIRKSFESDPLEVRFPREYFDDVDNVDDVEDGSLKNKRDKKHRNSYKMRALLFRPSLAVYLRKMYYWIRVKPRIQNHCEFNQIGVSYLSDAFFLLCVMPLSDRKLYSSLFSVSMDHSIYFNMDLDHESDYRCDEWMVFVVDSPKSSNGLSLVTGQIYRSDGKLIAYIVQEGLVSI
ncbi:Thioesterase/thiol ester dehydrase-isomerase, partial [Ascoidea rubescens DSM 1968]